MSTAQPGRVRARRHPRLRQGRARARRRPRLGRGHARMEACTVRWMCAQHGQDAHACLFCRDIRIIRPYDPIIHKVRPVRNLYVRHDRTRARMILAEMWMPPCMHTSRPSRGCLRPRTRHGPSCGRLHTRTRRNRVVDVFGQVATEACIVADKATTKNRLRANHPHRSAVLTLVIK